MGHKEWKQKNILLNIPGRLCRFLYVDEGSGGHQWAQIPSIEVQNALIV